MFTPPTIADFKVTFDRDFTYGTGKETVRDSDIQRALNQAATVFNPAIWDDTEAQDAYEYLSAHFLVTNIQMAGGLTKKNGTQNRGGGITQSKGAGQVNVAYGIPPRILEDAVLNQFMRTDYGMRYLQLITPRLIGNIATVSGRSYYTN
jgi:hypothetical protein